MSQRRKKSVYIRRIWFCVSGVIWRSLCIMVFICKIRYGIHTCTLPKLNQWQATTSEKPRANPKDVLLCAMYYVWLGDHWIHTLNSNWIQTCTVPNWTCNNQCKASYQIDACGAVCLLWVKDYCGLWCQSSKSHIESIHVVFPVGLMTSNNQCKTSGRIDCYLSCVIGSLMCVMISCKITHWIHIRTFQNWTS